MTEPDLNSANPGRHHYPFFDSEGEYIKTIVTDGQPTYYLLEVEPMNSFTASEADLDSHATAPVKRREFGRMSICYALPRDTAPERWHVYVEKGGESAVFCRFSQPGTA